MKRIGKILTLLFSLIMAFSCFACTAPTNSTSSNPDSSAQQSSSDVQSGSEGASSQSNQEDATITSLEISGQQTTANFLSDVSKNVTVKAIYSDNSQRTLSASEYNVFVEYYNATTAKVTVVHKGTGISKGYDVALSQKVCAHSYAQSAFVQPTTSQAGKREYTCGKCQDKYSQTIPVLNTTNYDFKESNATCKAPGMDIYTSEVYGTFTIETSAKLNHTTYNGKCEACQSGVGNLMYNYEDNSTIFWGDSSYPRLTELQDGTWLCGFDTWGAGYTKGTIVIVRSTDQGKTWTTNRITVSQHPDANCANTALFQLDNGDILCAYRAIVGESDAEKASGMTFSRSLHVAISKDNGYTWAYHSTIVSSTNLVAPNGTAFTASAAENAIKNVDYRLGFFEPHFGIVNDKLTVMYADDLTTYLLAKRGSFRADYETQYIISRTWEGTGWSSANIVLDGTKKKTVSNSSGFSITDYSRDGMPVFDRLSDGTYVLVVEGTYRDHTLPDSSGSLRTKDDNGNTIETHPFEILISYSKNGITWSDPVEIYTPKGQGTKASAPYVCVTDDDRIIVSFQTDEDAYALKGLTGDHVSIMKTIISDGTPVENITAENFYESQNPFFVPAGPVSSWNGMMVKDDYVYCVTGTNFPLNSIKMAKAKIPEKTPKDYHTTSAVTDYTVRSGNFGVQQDGWYRATAANSIITSNTETIYNGRISFDMFANTANDCGIIFRATEGATTYWENNNSSYYFFFVNFQGHAILSKVNGTGNTTIGAGVWNELNNYNGFVSEYEPNELIHIDIELRNQAITCWINGKAVIHSWDDINNYKGLLGTKVGFRAQKANTVFGNLTITPLD